MDKNLRELFLQYVADYVPAEYYYGADTIIKELGVEFTKSLIKLFKKQDNDKVTKIYHKFSSAVSKAEKEGKFVPEKYKLTLLILSEAFDRIIFYELMF